jgi:hypothetical protein
MAREVGHLAGQCAPPVGGKARSSPSGSRTFKLSKKDKQFEAKCWDVIGLYLGPSGESLGPVLR